MASKTKKWSGGAAGKSQIWAYSPPITATAPTWSLTCNGKTLTYPSNGTVADAVNGMLNLWQASGEPEFQEISVSVPSSLNAPAAPQGTGTNEIIALYITGNVTGGGYQLSWNGGVTPFLPDPTDAPSASDSGSSGNLNGAYRYSTTCLNVNPFGQIGETRTSPESVSVTVNSHSVILTVPLGPNNPAANQVCIGRRIYRTVAGGASGSERLVWTIWDNTTTAYTDNLADTGLGASLPVSNTTGIPWNVAAAQLQGILQQLSSILPGNVVVSGSGTPGDPWLVQFTGTLGTLKQNSFGSGLSALNYPVTIPAQPSPALVVTEIQRGVMPNAIPQADGQTLLLVSNAGVPFYVTSEVSGVIPPMLTITPIKQTLPPPQGQLSITESPATVTIARTVAARAGSNELQQITINPDAKSGSTFNLSTGGYTTNAIPVPPSAPSAVSNGTGLLAASGAANYYWAVTFLTASGETEPSAPSAALSLNLQQATVTIPTGASVVTGRRIYRTLAGGAITGPYYLVHTVADNTTTSYGDNVADGTIAANPQSPTTNGVLLGELEALTPIGAGNVQVSGANFSAYSGMALEQGFPDYPPVIATSIAAAPANPALTPSLSGGSLATGLYYYQVTSIDSHGESLPTTEASVQVQGPTGRVAISWSSASGANGYRIYRGTSSQNENTLIGAVGPSATSFIDYGTSPSPIIYKVEFIGSLAKSPQAVLTGSSGGVTILPPITIAETQAGYPVGNELQALGWTQKFGVGPPDSKSTFKITLPDLSVTTAAIAYDASAAIVLQAIRAAVPLANYNDFATSEIVNGNGANLVALTYQGNFAGKDVSLAAIDASGMIPSPGDSVSPYARRAQIGSPVGRNEIVTVTLDNTPAGGTLSLTATLANGNTLASGSLAYNATAATVQAAFPTGTMEVSGSAGGPYTIEAVGEAGNQKVVWSATSSLTQNSSPPSGTPPVSNTAAIPNPVVMLTPGTAAGALATGTYYYKVTAVNGQGETNGAEVHTAVTGPTGSVGLSWGAIPTATSYNIYRGTSAGGENVKLANTAALAFNDYGGTATSASPPGSNTATLPAPTGLAATAGTSGVLSAGSYYYKITATDTAGETTASSEATATVTADGSIALAWTAVAGATGYNVYRGTASGSENKLVVSIASGTQTAFYDTGVSTATTTSPPGSYTAPIAVPTLTAATGGSAGLLTGTHYYVVTALNSLGETTASNELSSTGSNVALAWSTASGATSYNVYRGTSAGNENVLIANVSGTSFIDSGASTATSHSPPGSNTTGLSAPTGFSVLANGSGGVFNTDGATYYYKITATNGAGETAPSTEQSVIAPLNPGGGIFPDDMFSLTWSMVAGATGYKIYRGTSAGSENLLVATLSNGASQTKFYDTGVSSPTSGSPSGTAGNWTFSASRTPLTGNLSAGTYYYVASDGSRMTFEKSISVMAGDSVSLSGLFFAGETISIYRGTSPGGEIALLGSVKADNSGNWSFYDNGASTPASASPPGSNTTTVTAPVQNAASAGTLGLLSATTYYYVVTATDGAGETTASNEQSIAVSADGDVLVSWNAVTGATGYKVYRGTSAGSENLLVATIASGSQTSYYDDGEATATSQSPPTVNTTGVSIPIQSAPTAGNGGILSTGTYYYEVTAYNGSNETEASNEESVTLISGQSDVLISWTDVPNATGYKVYRGTASGSENKLLATLASGTQTSFYDNGASTATTVSPPGSNTTTITIPTQTAATAATTGGALASAYYVYAVTAITAGGETTASNQEYISATGPTAVATVNWTADAGATGYKVYRGTGLAPPGAPTVATGPAGVLTGNYLYEVTFTNSTGETNGGTESATVSPSSQEVNLTNIPLGPAGTTGRKIYRTAAGGASGTEKLVHTIADNTTTTYTDNTADGSLGVNVPTANTTGTETVLVATVNSGSATSFDDSGPVNSAASPPGSNTAVIVAPTQTAPSTASGGALAANTYYYVVTALTGLGETTRSNEENIAVSASGEVTVNWTADTGATGYKIYRGTSGSGENVLVGTVGAVTSFVDFGSYFSTMTVTELFAGLSPQNDTQTITLTNAGGGTFGVLLGNQSATNLAFNISAANLQTSLQLLANVGSGNCTVSEVSSAGTTVYTVTFDGALAAQPQPLMSAIGIDSQFPPTMNTANYAVDTGESDGFGHDVFLFFPMSPPASVVAQAVQGGALATGTYYYVVTAIGTSTTGGQTIGETLPSVEVSSSVAGVPPGGGAPVGPASIELTWTPPTPPTGVPPSFVPSGYNIYRGRSQGTENELIGVIYGSSTTFIDDGTAVQKSTLQGGGQYVVAITGGSTDNFTLSFGGDTTGNISYNASQSTLQSDLQALGSIGGGGAEVLGPNGGPWNVYLTAAVAASGTLTGTMASIQEFASYTSVYGIQVFKAVAGSFTLSYGNSGNTTAGISYNASAAQLAAAVSALPIIAESAGSITVSATGPQGGPWGLTISATAQTSNLTISGSGLSLIGASGVFPSYPVTYAMATGPNFWDAPGNWSDGAPPSLYLAPPVIQAVVPVATDSTLLPTDANGNVTHGSLASGTTYYYIVTALNVNGETVGSAEASGKPFAGAYLYFNGTPTSGSYTLTYGGQTAIIAYNATANAIQNDLQALSTIGGGKCTVTGAGTIASPFVFQLAGTMAGTAPSPLTVNAASLVGATVSVRNVDTRSLAVSWSEVYGATGYNVYRGTAAGSENVLVAMIASPDQTVFIDDGTYTTTSASPPTDANSYHTAVGDDVYFTNSSVSCLDNIAADISCGYSVHGGFNGSNRSQVNSLTIDASFTGFIGPPVANPAGYTEYRPTLLQIQGPPAGVFPVVIGNGSGSGSANLGLDTGTSQIAMSIVTLATPTGTIPVAMTWIGANAASEIDLSFGSLGIAPYPGQSAQLGTLRQAYQQNQNSDTTLIVGAGCSAIPTFIKSGGITTLFANVTALTGKGGTVNQQAGAVTGTLNLTNCDYVSQSTAALGMVNVAGGATFDRSQDSRPLGMGTVNLYAGASYLDPHGCTITTGQSYLAYNLVQCGYEDVTLELGRNLSAQRTQN